MKSYKSLRELTGQESGIVIQGNAVMVCNWVGVGLENGALPALDPMGYKLLPMPADAKEYVLTEQYEVSDVTQCLPYEYDLVYDYNGDIERMANEEHPTSGTVYKVTVDGKDILAIAPEDWS